MAAATKMYVSEADARQLFKDLGFNKRAVDGWTKELLEKKLNRAELVDDSSKITTLPKKSKALYNQVAEAKEDDVEVLIGEPGKNKAAKSGKPEKAAAGKPGKGKKTPPPDDDEEEDEDLEDEESDEDDEEDEFGADEDEEEEEDTDDDEGEDAEEEDEDLDEDDVEEDDEESDDSEEEEEEDDTDSDEDEESDEEDEDEEDEEMATATAKKPGAKKGAATAAGKNGKPEKSGKSGKKKKSGGGGFKSEGKIAFLRTLLLQATAAKPIAKDKLIRRMQEKFPDSADSVKTTVNNQMGYHLKAKGWVIDKNDRGYWLDPKKNKKMLKDKG